MLSPAFAPKLHCASIVSGVLQPCCSILVWMWFPSVLPLGQRAEAIGGPEDLKWRVLLENFVDETPRWCVLLEDFADENLTWCVSLEDFANTSFCLQCTL